MTEVRIRAWEAALLAVDCLADEGDGLLIDACGVPALDGGIIRLPLLVTRTTLPAMADEEVSGGSQRICARADKIDAAVAVEIHAVAHHVQRQELRLADFTMCGTLGVDIQRTAADELQAA